MTEKKAKWSTGNVESNWVSLGGKPLKIPEETLRATMEAAKRALGPTPKCTYCSRESIAVFTHKPLQPDEGFLELFVRQNFPTIYACRYHVVKARNACFRRVLLK